MHKGFMAAGAIFGGLAVALGAFGAHGLEQLTTDARMGHGFETGASYQLYHAFALLITALVYDRAPNQFIKWAGYFFISGILLFSGSLYLLTFLKIYESVGINIVGPLTPLGGLLLIGGWIFLLLGATRNQKGT